MTVSVIFGGSSISTTFWNVAMKRYVKFTERIILELKPALLGLILVISEIELANQASKLKLKTMAMDTITVIQNRIFQYLSVVLATMT